jgi:3-carboxy-cis,cis-muconate cycloisomerase
MPHKRNPMLSESIVGMRTIARAGAALLLELNMQEHERDMRPWHAEWEAIPELCIVTSGALAKVTEVVRGLEVDPDRMASNLAETKGLIVSERVMMELAPQLGRERAHDLVYEASMTAFQDDRPLAEVLLADRELADLLPSEQLETLLDPAGYTGLCAEFCDRVLELWRPRGSAS